MPSLTNNEQNVILYERQYIIDLCTMPITICIILITVTRCPICIKVFPEKLMEPYLFNECDAQIRNMSKWNIYY